MKNLIGIAMLLLLLIHALGGCSPEEDIAEVEREMLAQEDSATGLSDDTSLTPAPPPSRPDTAQYAVDASAIPSEATAAPDMPQRPVGNGFEVQVAGCENPDYASFLVDRYRKRGYEPYVTRAMVDGREYYRVRIGIFETYGEANRVKLELADKYSIEPWVAPTP